MRQSLEEPCLISTNYQISLKFIFTIKSQQIPTNNDDKSFSLY